MPTGCRQLGSSRMSIHSFGVAIASSFMSQGSAGMGPSLIWLSQQRPIAVTPCRLRADGRARGRNGPCRGRSGCRAGRPATTGTRTMSGASASASAGGWSTPQGLGSVAGAFAPERTARRDRRTRARRRAGPSPRPARIAARADLVPERMIGARRRARRPDAAGPAAPAPPRASARSSRRQAAREVAPPAQALGAQVALAAGGEG